jgi:hypothetical protein
MMITGEKRRTTSLLLLCTGILFLREFQLADDLLSKYSQGQRAVAESESDRGRGQLPDLSLTGEEDSRRI